MNFKSLLIILMSLSPFIHTVKFNYAKFTCPLMSYVNSYIKKTALPYEEIKKTYIMGNTSCDLDSFLSSYLLSIPKNFDKDINKTNKLYLPLINCGRNELPYRFDIHYLCKRFGINRQSLPYITDKKVQRDLKLNKDAKVILVDHNKPDSSQFNMIANHVTGVYDHHKDSNFHFYNMKTNKNITFPLGSCTTLILKKFFITNPLLFKYVSPLLSVSAILMDTENFNKELYKRKWIKEDKDVFNKVIAMDKTLTPQYINNFYKELSSLKYSEKNNLNLGVHGILAKDKKSFVWNEMHNTIRGGWSTLQVSFDKIIKKYGYNRFFDTIVHSCQEKHYDIYLCNYSDKFYSHVDSKINLKVKCFIIYNYEMNDERFEDLIKGVSSLLGMRLYKREDVVFDKKNNRKFTRFYVHQAISRKHFEPVIRDYFLHYNVKTENEA